MKTTTFFNLTKILFIFAFFLYSNCLVSEILSFKEGEAASYTIYQQVKSECVMGGEFEAFDSECTIDLDLRILSTGDNGSYPFQVELILRRVLISETDNNFFEKSVDDSQSLISSFDSFVSAETEYQIDTPIIFNVNADFKVFEVTSESSSCRSDPLDYKIFLTQLFQLSGEDLQENQLYSRDCFRVIEFEDTSYDENEFQIEQDFVYKVTTIDADHITAVLTGNAEIMNEDSAPYGSIEINGTVQWEIRNPLLQRRVLNLVIEEGNPDLFISVKALINQTWEPKIISQE